MYDTANSSGQNVATSTSKNNTWPGPAPGALQAKSDNDDGGGASCPAQQLSLSAAGAASMAAANDWSTLTLRLSASTADEDSWDQWAWKRFGAANMELDFFWRNAPSAPTGYGTQGVFDAATGKTVTDCSTNPGKPDWVSTNAPTWQATINDVDSADSTNAGNIDGEFSSQNMAEGNTGTQPASQNEDNNGTGLNPNANGGDEGADFTASRSGTEGEEYHWQAYGTAQGSDPLTNAAYPQKDGPSSPACFFEDDDNAPAAPALPTSSNYKSGATSGQPPVGTPGKFTFTDPANVDPIDKTNDVVGYYYGFSSDPDSYVQAGSRAGRRR